VDYALENEEDITKRLKKLPPLGIDDFSVNLCFGLGFYGFFVLSSKSLSGTKTARKVIKNE